ncbi:glycosyltransferase family 4 protein [Gemella sanguinis]|jgi:accessory sec system glycosylation protein gtfA|uniref:Glycosyl transferase family 1 domain-containing protein n=1 Tax=Gemella sanguinis TaxID=84135 RepID=A0A2N6SE27_9BACL|nr:glycosyltransferase family 4 protein [Gemella sanguinis]PMC52204.1 hypothetical protein CJ218_06305 [Gemella sanguinis]
MTKIAISFSNSYTGKVLNGIDRLQVKRTEYLEKIGITHNIVSTLKKNIGKENHILNYLFSNGYNTTNKENKELYITNEDNEIIIDMNNGKYTFNGVGFSSYYSLITHLLKVFIPNDALCFFDWFGEPINYLFEGVKHARTIGVVHSNHICSYVPTVTNNHQLWHREFDYYITTNDIQTEDLKKRFPKKANRILTVVPYDTFYLEESVLLEDKVSHNNNNTLQLVTASYLEDNKCIDYLIQIMRLVVNKNPNVYLNIYGQGTQLEYLQDLASSLGVSNNIYFHGHYEDATILKKYDVYVSTSPNEAFATVLLEAMSLGLPVIGLDVLFANKNYIKNGYNGYLIPYSVVSIESKADIYFEQIAMYTDFSNKLLTLTKDEIDTLGENAKQFVEKFYGEGRAVQDYNKLLEDVEKTEEDPYIPIKRGDLCTGLHVNHVKVPREWSYVMQSYNNSYICDLDVNIIATTEFNEGEFPIIKKIKWKE